MNVYFFYCRYPQMRVGVKTNEFTVVPLVLKELYSSNLLENVIITIEAIGCQKSIAELIINCSAEYLLGIKGNQSELHDQVKIIFSSDLKQVWLG